MKRRYLNAAEEMQMSRDMRKHATEMATGLITICSVMNQQQQAEFLADVESLADEKLTAVEFAKKHEAFTAGALSYAAVTVFGILADISSRSGGPN